MAEREGLNQDKRSNVAQGETSYVPRALSMAKPCIEGFLLVSRRMANERKLLVMRKCGFAC